ncbi:MAG: hypothetical protein ABIG90_02425 [bacterium]
MKTQTITQQNIIEQGAEVLLRELGPSKASEFWNSLKYSNKDYTKLRKKMFKDLSVQDIAKEIKNR